MPKVTNYEESIEEMPKAKTESSTVKLMFTQNRSYELCVGYKIYPFSPNGVTEVPRSVIEHPDFESQKDFFVIL